MRLGFDYETASRVDIRKEGGSRYARDPSTRILMVAWSVDEGPVQQWTQDDFAEPAELKEMLRDPSVVKQAFNYRFEQSITEHCWGIKTSPAEWSCTMALGLSLALPGKLSAMGKALGLPPELLKSAGLVFINKFCKPRLPTVKKPYEWRDSSTDELDWLEFCAYNRQDVRAEQAIFTAISKYDLAGDERALFELDGEINEAGLPIDLERVRRCIAIRDYALGDITARMRRITNVANPNATQQLLPWLRQHGYPFADLKKGHVERATVRAVEEEKAAEDDVTRTRRRRLGEVLALRQEAGKTSVSKFDALLRTTDHDGRLRGAFQFAGAGRTNRWSGRGVQPQNLVKPSKAFEKLVPVVLRHIDSLEPADFCLIYDRPMEALTAALRPTIAAPPGYRFGDADLSAIENIVAGYQTDEEKILSVFRQGRDPYLDFAQFLFDKPYDVLAAEFAAGDKGPRTTSKPAVLGAAYGLGPGKVTENEDSGELEATGLLGYAWAMKINLTPEEAEKSVRIWRSTYRKVVNFWYRLEEAAHHTVLTGQATRCGPIRFRMDAPFLRMVLPSGRALSYLHPEVADKRMHWGDVKPTLFYRAMVKHQWGRESTWGGKLFENSTQAIARDLLGLAMLRAKKRGLRNFMHIHDQILILSEEDKAEEELAVLKECLTEPPEWAQDIPLKCGGFTSSYFIKD